MKIFHNSQLRVFSLPSEDGFTLIELLVVIVIVGVLATMTLAMINLPGVRQRGRDVQRKSDLRQIQTALELYRSDIGSYPASLPACGSALTSGSNSYMQKVPCDPLNTGQYTYRYTTTGSTYSLIGCMENVNDPQKDATNNTTYCTGGQTNWSFTVTNP
jgi:type II secretion system protein G